MKPQRVEERFHKLAGEKARFQLDYRPFERRLL
jgi:hypothetical protein